MKNLKIIITMAGNGSRFKKIGYTVPKHEIIANDKSLFTWSLLSLSDFFDCEFIFLVRKDNYRLENIESELKALSITKYTILEIDELTSGQADSALCADSVLSNDDSVLIYNIDTHINPGVIKKTDISDNCDGFLHSFEAVGDSWSFVDFDQDYNVTRVTEKVRISKYGTIGLYYFKEWKTYCNVLNENSQKIIDVYNETYIAPLYEYMIEQGLNVKTKVVPANSLHILGTPDDLKQFDNDFLKNIK